MLNVGYAGSSVVCAKWLAEFRSLLYVAFLLSLITLTRCFLLMSYIAISSEFLLSSYLQSRHRKSRARADDLSILHSHVETRSTEILLNKVCMFDRLCRERVINEKVSVT